MARNPFRDPMRRRTFDDVLRAARDSFSSLYYGKTPLGPRHPTRGSTLHHAFWNGWNMARGAAPRRDCTVAGSLARVAFNAGEAFRREVGQ